MLTNTLNNQLAHITTAALIAAASTHADAAIIGTTGQAELIGAPVSALYGALPGAPAYCWNEQSSFLIPAVGLNVNVIGNGFWTGPTANSAMYAGNVDSHFVHFDASSGVANVSGTITFSSQIVAVIYESAYLSMTDFALGAPGTAYETGNPLRSSTAALMLSQITVAGNVLTFNLWAQAAMMQNRMSELRVLTDGTVPTPGALALLGLAGVAARRRKR